MDEPMTKEEERGDDFEKDIGEESWRTRTCIRPRSSDLMAAAPCGSGGGGGGGGGVVFFGSRARAARMNSSVTKWPVKGRFRGPNRRKNGPIRRRSKHSKA
jgi:hypothetical protein